jgi:hypothetical protein
MTKAEETRLENLTKKQGFETLSSLELRTLKRLLAKKKSEGSRRKRRSAR